jgi:hypothetical protein
MPWTHSKSQSSSAWNQRVFANKMAQSGNCEWRSVCTQRAYATATEDRSRTKTQSFRGR